MCVTAHCALRANAAALGPHLEKQKQRPVGQPFEDIGKVHASLLQHTCKLVCVARSVGPAVHLEVQQRAVHY